MHDAHPALRRRWPTSASDSLSHSACLVRRPVTRPEMLPETNKDAPPEFIFVGGTALKGRGGSIRSSLARRALSDKRAKRHQDASDKLESLLRKTKTAQCSCQRVLSPAGPSPGSGTDPDALVLRQPGPSYRAIRPKASNPQGNDEPVYYCANCGRSLPPALATAPPQTSMTGNRDPLIPSDPQLEGVNIDAVLNFAVTLIWPSFRLFNFAPLCYRSWTFPFNDKLKVYTTLWSASYHQDTLRLSAGASPSGQVDSREQLYLRGLVLKSLREEIGKPPHLTSSDGLLMAVLFLAVNVAHRTGLRRDPNPFSPPFTDLHGLHFYGSRQYHPWHWDIVHTIINRFGGIEVIKAFALAWLLSIADIMNAVNTLQKPIYPMLDIAGRVLDLAPPLTLFPVPVDTSGASIPPPGSAFNELSCLSPPVKQEIVSVFVEIGQLAAVLQYNAIQGNRTPPEILDLLGDCRNLVHHRLFSLPDENDDASDYITPNTTAEPAESEGLDQTREIYLTYRLTVTLYAIHVTFPTPRIAPQQRLLSSALNLKLRGLADMGISNTLLLWPILVLFISVGEDSDVAIEWLSRLKELCESLEIDTRDKLLHFLRGYAWVDVAFPDLEKRILEKIIER